MKYPDRNTKEWLERYAPEFCPHCGSKMHFGMFRTHEDSQTTECVHTYAEIVEANEKGMYIHILSYECDTTSDWMDPTKECYRRIIAKLNVIIDELTKKTCIR